MGFQIERKCKTDMNLIRFTLACLMTLFLAACSQEAKNDQPEDELKKLDYSTIEKNKARVQENCLSTLSPSKEFLKHFEGVYISENGNEKWVFADSSAHSNGYVQHGFGQDWNEKQELSDFEILEENKILKFELKEEPGNEYRFVIKENSEIELEVSKSVDGEREVSRFQLCIREDQEGAPLMLIIPPDPYLSQSPA